jgi:serine/threonine protein kinase
MIAFDMGIQILNALQILHNGGFVHCDLKPDNICVKETVDP